MVTQFSTLASTHWPTLGARRQRAGVPKCVRACVSTCRRVFASTCVPGSSSTSSKGGGCAGDLAALALYTTLCVVVETWQHAVKQGVALHCSGVIARHPEKQRICCIPRPLHGGGTGGCGRRHVYLLWYGRCPCCPCRTGRSYHLRTPCT